MKKITPQIISDYVKCPRKAFLRLFTDDKGITNDYVQSVAEDIDRNRYQFIKRIKEKLSSSVIKHNRSILLETTLETKEFLVSVDILSPIEDKKSPSQEPNYSHTLIVGTYKISKLQKLQLAFIGYVLSMTQNLKPVSGVIVAMDGKSHKIKLITLYKEVQNILTTLQNWRISSKLESPPTILNNHCSCCMFQQRCTVEAKENDHLSLLGGIGRKEIDKYNNKGIFTINQLSYQFRPRKKEREEITILSLIPSRCRL